MPARPSPITQVMRQLGRSCQRVEDEGKIPLVRSRFQSSVNLRNARHRPRFAVPVPSLAGPRGSCPMEENAGEVTLLLQRWQKGDPEVLGALIPLVYQQLHTIAQGYMRRERGDHTLQPTALVNEVYMRLLNQRKVTWNDRVHFFVFAARIRRNILKDHARAHKADRRGGGVMHLPMSEELAWVGSSPEQVLDLNRALDKLELLDARKAPWKKPRRCSASRAPPRSAT
jgi:RNA polymerase sigma factor (TIGR02999 family)